MIANVWKGNAAANQTGIVQNVVPQYARNIDSPDLGYWIKKLWKCHNKEMPLRQMENKNKKESE